MPSSNNRQERMSRLLRNRRARRHTFFLSEFPAFGLFLLISYGGIIWVAITILTSSTSNKQNSFIIARFWFQRFVGIANLSAFISFWVQAHGLIGSKGINPIQNQLQSIQTKVNSGMLLLSKYEYFPTLLWLCFKKKNRRGSRGDRLLQSSPNAVDLSGGSNQRRSSRNVRNGSIVDNNDDNESNSSELVGLDIREMKYSKRFDIWIHILCGIGCLSSVLIILPFLTFFPTSLFFFINTIIYLSIKTGGAEFMQLQWDSMLIEMNVCCFWLELDALVTLKWLYLPSLDKHSDEWKLGTSIWRYDNYASRIGIILIYWLHYRLMVCAGFVKLSSGCPSWREGSAMRYHFWTQPIPNKLSYIAWKLQGSSWKAKLSSWGSIISEMIFPLFLFLPYRICRLIAAINTFGLMFVIFATGNFGFFNILTATMGVLCFDDGLWPELVNNLIGITTDQNNTSNSYLSTEFSAGVIGYVIGIIAGVWMVWILFISIRTLFHVTYRRLQIPDCCGLRLWILKFQMWGVVNSYGLFARMTTFRHELIIQGTMDDVSNCTFEELNDTSDVGMDDMVNNDSNELVTSKKQAKSKQKGKNQLLEDDNIEQTMLDQTQMNEKLNMDDDDVIDDNKNKIDDNEEEIPKKRINWKTYEFKYKPGDINRSLPCALFHLPRLDWRLWFLPLREFNRENDKWFVKFIKELMRNNETVTNIIEYNPFSSYGNNYPINAIRILKYEYRFPSDEIDDEYGAKALGIKNKHDLKWENGKYWSRRHLQTLYIPTMTKEDLFTKNEMKQMLQSRNMIDNNKYTNENNRTRAKNQLMNDSLRMEQNEALLTSNITNINTAQRIPSGTTTDDIDNNNNNDDDDEDTEATTDDKTNDAYAAGQ